MEQDFKEVKKKKKAKTETRAEENIDYGIGFSKEQAKADLEKRIAEKLSRMSETDLEELFALHEEQRKEKKDQTARHEKKAYSKKDPEVEEQITIQQIEPEPEPEPTPEPEPEPTPEPEPEPKIEERVEAFFKGCENEDGEDEIKLSVSEVLRQKFDKSKRFCSAVLTVAIGRVRTMIDTRKTVEPSIEKQKKIRQRRYVFVNLKRRFLKKERKVAIKMVEFINRMDHRNDILAEKTTEIVIKGNRNFNFAREWAEINKKRLLVVLLSIVVLALGTVGIFNKVTAYEYAYNGRTLGMVKNQEDVLRILKTVSGQLTREYGTEISIDKDQDIVFTRVFAVNKDIDDMEDVLTRLTYMQDMNAKAYALYIEGKRTAILDTEQRANAILQNIKDTYMQQNNNIEYESVSFAETVEIKQIDTQLGRIQNPDDVIHKILTGAVEQRVHSVKAGETFSGIAKQYGLTQAQLEATNPGINPAKLSIEQQIVLTQAVPLVTVQTVEIATYIEAIPYETTYENNSSIYKGEKSTKVKGVNGERQVVAKIVRNNGTEVGKVELSSTTLSDPVAAIIFTGTKEPPALQGTGKFIYPVTGARLTSKFGTRNGRMHYGIDLAIATGTTIRASDGGTVIFAGYSGSYGYVVKIDHGGNFVTVYAHCSKLFVKKGDKVYQGQHIANVGNTGRSTGSHCHFEVQVNGVQKNPLNYL